MSHVVITGGAGFIGSHLCEWYLKSGNQVTAIDNYLTGTRRNLAAILDHPNFELIEHDVSVSMPKTDRADFVLHFACPASPSDFEKLPIEILKVDSLGTFHALDLAKRDNARFLIASTSEVYGDPLVHPQKEDYWGNVNPIGDRSCYDETKRFAEATTMAYHRKFGVNTGIVRIFNTYGPRMRLDDGRVVPNFCGQALRNEPLTVYGQGQQTRSFCYVDDLVEGITRLVASQEHLPVNIGNTDEYTILDFAKFVIESVPGTKSKIEYRPPLHGDDPKQRKPVIERARTILGWEPKISLKDGLSKTLAYFREQIRQ